MFVLGSIGVVLAGGVLFAQEVTWPSAPCRNGVIDPGEECDPGWQGHYEPDLGGRTCVTEGYSGGILTCSSFCTLDRSACEEGTKFPATGQTDCWRIYGGPRDCAGTGQDGDIRAGAPLSYSDNGDGTITDHNTGLMWERKDYSGGIHDLNRRYGWLESFSVFIDALNNTCEGEGLVLCDSDEFCGAGSHCGLAGYRDWRMPNIRELLSIVDYGRYYPAIDPAFHHDCTGGCTDCSCTGTDYISSTTYRYTTYYAWGVYAWYGYTGRLHKVNGGLVRAVRGGLLTDP